MPDQTDSPIDVRVEPAAGRLTLRISGELSIATAGVLRDALLAALETPRDTALDAAGVSSVHLSGLQLFCSAHRAYIRRGVELDLHNASEPLRQAARAAGYDARYSICPYRQGNRCLWAGID